MIFGVKRMSVDKDMKDRWDKLGKALGFKTRKLKRHEEKGTLIDAIWWDDLGGKLIDEKLWIPAVAIEVEATPNRKPYKADILGFNTLKPLIGIIHMVKSKIGKGFEAVQKSVQGYIDTEAQCRVIIFTDDDLERLEKKSENSKTRIGNRFHQPKGNSNAEKLNQPKR